MSSRTKANRVDKKGKFVQISSSPQLTNSKLPALNVSLNPVRMFMKLDLNVS
jgi:hypothetical protein